MANTKRNTADEGIHAARKEWDETLCPICMDHPHNAVLLICSSHEKGCRAYICNTSCRHSNCLEQFKKVRESCERDPLQPSSLLNGNRLSVIDTPMGLRMLIRDLLALSEENSVEQNFNIASSSGLSESAEENSNHQEGREGVSNLDHSQPNSLDNNANITRSRIIWSRVFRTLRRLFQEGNTSVERAFAGVSEEVEAHRINQEARRRSEIQLAEGNDTAESDGEINVELDLKCPLCRGTVSGWEVVQEAREYLDLKPRSCSWESCTFSGNYRELRRHARAEHPTARPADVDPSRQRAWSNLEHQLEHADVLSAAGSGMPGAVIHGDYIIDNEGDYIIDNEDGSLQAPDNNDGSETVQTSLTVVIRRPVQSLDAPGSASRRIRRQRSPPSRLNLQDVANDAGEPDNDETPRPRRPVQPLDAPGSSSRRGRRQRSAPRRPNLQDSANDAGEPDSDETPRHRRPVQPLDAPGSSSRRGRRQRSAPRRPNLQDGANDAGEPDSAETQRPRRPVQSLDAPGSSSRRGRRQRSPPRRPNLQDGANDAGEPDSDETQRPRRRRRRYTRFSSFRHDDEQS